MDSSVQPVRVPQQQTVVVKDDSLTTEEILQFVHDYSVDFILPLVLALTVGGGWVAHKYRKKQE